MTDITFDDFDSLFGEIADEDIPEYIEDYDKLKKPEIGIIPPYSVRKKNKHWGRVPTNAEALFYIKNVLYWHTVCTKREHKKFEPTLAKQMAHLGVENMSDGQKYAIRNQYIDFHMEQDIFQHTHSKEY